MSNTKIVIDKEKVGKSEHSEIINAAISVLIKHGVATEIQIDQSIEDAANLRLSEQKEKHDKEMEEFAEWCSVNGWYFYSKDNKWRKHGNGGFEYLATTELINKFNNR